MHILLKILFLLIFLINFSVHAFPIPKSKKATYDVWRKNRIIGTHEILFSENNGNLNCYIVTTNEDGEVIGVTTLLISPDKYYVGYGYVIPTPLVKRAVTQILATGKHVKPSIGIMMGIIDDRELYEKLKTEGLDHFLEIKEVIVDSPAYRFGLLAGDIIVSIDDKDIQVVPQVIELLWQRNPGDQIRFDVYRNGEHQLIDVVLGTVEPKLIETNQFYQK